MADLTVTAASVLKGASAITATGLLGATVTAGQTLYKDATASNVLKLADANGSTATAAVVGIALSGGASGQPVTYVTEDDDFTPGATLVTGKIYVLSNTAGGLMPAADLVSGDYPQVVFIAKSTTKAVMKIVNQTTAATP